VYSEVTGIDAVNYGYDTRGRLTTVTQGSGTNLRSLTYAYGSDGFVERIVDTQNRATLYQRDLAGRITQTTLPGSRLLQMTYDANSNVTGITPPTKPPHTFNYTPVDLAEHYTPPTVAGIATPATHYAYNRDKQSTRITRPDGQTMDFAYDTGGRLSSLTPIAAVGSVSTEPSTYAYHPTTGQLTSITTPTTTLGYTWDGFLLMQETVAGSISGTLTRTWNTDFNVTGLAINGSSIAFAFDADNLLTQAGAMTLTRNAQNGFLTGTALGNTTTTQTYNAFGEMNRFTANQSASTLFDVQYAHDTLGRITTQTETLGDGVTSTYQYGYDLAGRLISVSKNGGTQESYAYDPNGNRTQGNGTTATHDDQDRLLSYGNNTYNYTANGELQEKRHSRAGGNPEVTTYTYDVFGNLRHATLPDATQIDYLTDGRNRRIGKKINGVMTQGFLYQDQLRIAAELDGSNNVVSRFVYGTKINVPDYLIKGTDTYRLITDHLGSVRLVVHTTTGAIAQRLNYDSFGNVLTDTAPGFQPFGFAGGLYDPHTQLTRFGARDYDAQTGRWTAKDPIGFNGGDSNLFAYVGGDPINAIDPLGLLPSSCTATPQSAVICGDAGGAMSPASGAANATGGLVIKAWTELFNKPKPGSKPKNCPTGTVPIDETEWSDDHEVIKKGVDAKPNDWTGITPEGDVITGDEDGEAVNHGPASSYVGSGKPSQR